MARCPRLCQMHVLHLNLQLPHLGLQTFRFATSPKRVSSVVLAFVHWMFSPLLSSQRANEWCVNPCSFWTAVEVLLKQSTTTNCRVPPSHRKNELCNKCVIAVLSAAWRKEDRSVALLWPNTTRKWKNGAAVCLDCESVSASGAGFFSERCHFLIL